MNQSANKTESTGSRWEFAAYLIRDRRLGLGMLGGGLIFFALALAGLNVMPCPFLQVTGLPCPGCGMTRSCMAALQGNWGDVLRFNPFGSVFAIFWAIVGFGLLLPEPQRKRFAKNLAIVETKTRWGGWVALALAIYSLTRWL